MQQVLALVLAQQPAGGGADLGSLVDLSQLIQYGVLGLIFLCVILRKFVVPEWVLRQAEERAAAERAELTRRLEDTQAQVTRLQQVFEDQMIPTLTNASMINARYLEELQALRMTGHRTTNLEPPGATGPGGNR